MINNAIPHIELKNLNFNYPVKGKNFSSKKLLLSNINLKLLKNDITALTGDNGTGKTTLGKLISGILKPLTGDILIEGKNIKGLDLGKIGTKLGYLFQNPERQIFATTVYEDISFPLRIKGEKSEVIRDKAEIIMKDLDILHLRNKYPFNLSQGEKQRVALAGILVNNVDYLVLDEPTTALDVYKKETLGTLLTNIHSRGVGILIISHDKEFIHTNCSRFLSINHLGEISG